MDFLLGVCFELAMIIVALKAIALGFHFIKTGFKSLRTNGDKWLMNLGNRKPKEEEVKPMPKASAIPTLLIGEGNVE